jgi:hypothetical protein
MGFHTIDNEVQYGLIAFDADGVERPEADGKFTQKLIEEVKTQPITNVFFFSHGWKGDVPAAIEQYNKWIAALIKSPDSQKAQQLFPKFRPLLIGLHWPSLPWGEEEARSDGSFAVAGSPLRDSLLEEYVQRLGDRSDIVVPLRTIINEARRNMSPGTLPDQVRHAYLDLNAALGLQSGGVSAPPDADREGFDPEDSYQAGNEDGANFGELNLGGLLGPLRQLSYWTMKKRARTVGEGGMHEFLKALQTATADKGTLIHLMGHSFGTIVVSGMIGGPNAQGQLERPIDSLALIQGAVSLWCYASSIPFHDGGSGYFYPNLDGKVRGPIFTTQSRFDNAVGRFYPLASRLRGSASFAADLPEFGAIGAYGIQGLSSDVIGDTTMLPASSSYGFERGKIYNLNSSQYICHGDGASGAHSDIAGPEVAHAIWEAAFASVR